jgi:hypothetical protein
MTTTKTMRGALVLGISLAVGCHHSTAGNGNVAQSGAALKIDYLGSSDVVGFKFSASAVACGDGGAPAASTTDAFVNLQDNLASGGLSPGPHGLGDGSGHVFASAFFSLPPGCYDIVGTPASAVDPSAHTFTASTQCAAATAAGVVVTSGHTTQVSTLISQCAGSPGPGGVDVAVALNHPPTIVLRIPDTTGFQCELLQVCAFVSDVDNDPLQVSFAEASPVGAPPAIVNVDATLMSLGMSGGIKRYSQCAHIAVPDLGSRGFVVTAFDLLKDGATIESALPMGQTSHATFDFMLRNQPGFGPECLAGGVVRPIEDSFAVVRAADCAWSTPEVYYCSAGSAMSGGFDLASTCPGGTFDPASVFPSCDALGGGGTAGTGGGGGTTGAAGAGGTTGAAGSGGTGGAGGTTGAADADGDGVPDVLDLCPGTAASAAVNSRGCAASQVVAKRNDTFPSYGLTFTKTGDPGRAGGVTFAYTGIDFSTDGGHFNIYWVPNDDAAFGPYGISLDGPVEAPETWTLSAGESSLPGGVAVFHGNTKIHLFDGSTPALQSRLTLTATSGSTPLAWQTTADLAITAELGTMALEIPHVAASTFTVVAKAEVFNGSAWVPYLDDYDAAKTPPEAKEAFISYGGSFYDK